MHVPQRASQRFNFPFVRVLLPFCNLKRLEHFFHVVERLAKRINDPVHFLNRLLNRGRGSWLPLRGRWFGMPGFRNGFTARFLGIWRRLRGALAGLRARRRPSRRPPSTATPAPPTAGTPGSPSTRWPPAAGRLRCL